MVFNPKEFINFSRGLCKPGLSEAEYRTAVSRSLYGVFLWAREELDQRGQKVKATTEEDKPLEHGWVRQRFKHGPFQHFQVSHRLGSLYQLRNQSDYDLDVIIRESHLQQALEYVSYIELAFETYLFARPPDSS